MDKDAKSYGFGSRAATVRRLSGVVLASAAVVFAGWSWQTVAAATYQGPTEAPPGGNIPVTVWNRMAATGTQTNAAIAVDGGGPAPDSFVGIAVGSPTLDMGLAAGGQNLFYGITDYAKMNAADYLMMLQVQSGATTYNRFYVDRTGGGRFYGALRVESSSTLVGSVSVGSASLNLGSTTTGQNALYAAARYPYMHPTGDFLLKLQTYETAYDDRLTVDRDGNLEATGRIHGKGCVGKTFVGLTSSGGPSGDGKFTAAWLIANYAPGGYGVVNARCAADYPGSHVCRSEEIMESFACAAAGSPILNIAIVPDGTPAFVNGGPPGYAALANDCVGWTASMANAYARVWFFNTVTGGYGSQTPCSTSAGINFACCQ